MVSNTAICAYGDISHYMGEGPYASALTDVLSLYYCRRMYEYTIHRDTWIGKVTGSCETPFSISSPLPQEANRRTASGE